MNTPTAVAATQSIPVPAGDTPPHTGAIYVDLDGTLAHYDGWKAPEIIGDPIVPMMDRVKTWLMDGKRVKIFTARFPEHHGHVREWLFRHSLGGVEVTNVKGIDGYEFWDDRAVPVEPNTGRVLHVGHMRLSWAEKDIADLRAQCNQLQVDYDAASGELESIREACDLEEGLPLPEYVESLIADSTQSALKLKEIRDKFHIPATADIVERLEHTRKNQHMIYQRTITERDRIFQELEAAEAKLAENAKSVKGYVEHSRELVSDQYHEGVDLREELEDRREVDRQIREALFVGDPGSTIDAAKAVWKKVGDLTAENKELRAARDNADKECNEALDVASRTLERAKKAEAKMDEAEVSFETVRQVRAIIDCPTHQPTTNAVQDLQRDSQQKSKEINRLVEKLKTLEAREVELQAALSRKQAGTVEDGEKCGDCGRHYQLVYRVPNEVWAKIAPNKEQLGDYPEYQYGGLLCPDCAHKRATDDGFSLYFDASEGDWESNKTRPVQVQFDCTASELANSFRGIHKAPRIDGVYEDMANAALSNLASRARVKMPDGVPTAEEIAKLHYEDRKKRNTDWDVMSWVEYRENHPERQQQYIYATGFILDRLAPFLHAPNARAPINGLPKPSPLQDGIAVESNIKPLPPLVLSREDLGAEVRGAWINWAISQPNPKPSWLVPYEHLSEPDKEADRQIGDHIWNLAGRTAVDSKFTEKPETETANVQ